jgi:hypothetical protein
MSRRALGWRTCVRAGAARRKAMERHSPFGGGAGGSVWPSAETKDENGRK